MAPQYTVLDLKEWLESWRFSIPDYNRLQTVVKALADAGAMERPSDRKAATLVAALREFVKSKNPGDPLPEGLILDLGVEDLTRRMTDLQRRLEALEEVTARYGISDDDADGDDGESESENPPEKNKPKKSILIRSFRRLGFVVLGVIVAWAVLEFLAYASEDLLVFSFGGHLATLGDLVLPLWLLVKISSK